MMLAQLSCAILAAATIQFCPQPRMRVRGFWGDKLDLLERNWMPECARRLDRGFIGFTRNLFEAMLLAEERSSGRGDFAARIEAHVRKEVAAQHPDGYVGRYTPHFTDFTRHELYAQGYYIEAAVRHMDFTQGKDRRYFDAAIRLADFLDATFGPAPKRTWTDGHPGVEKALLTLADAVDRYDGPGKGTRYAELARYMVRHQHDLPEYRHRYCQADVPAVEMREAAGHAVRATYFYAGLTGAAERRGDGELATAARRLFESAIDRKGYLTGGVGANWKGEAFGRDFSLSNGRGYLEGCAACGMYDWLTELSRLDGPGRYEDVRERLMYNALLGTFNADFTAYAYPNPTASAEPRYAWHTLPCCVGNVPRVLEDYKNRMWAVSAAGDRLYLLHFISSTGGEATVGGVKLALSLETDYPADGRMHLTIAAERPVAFPLVIRYPNRAESALYAATPASEHGYRERRVELSAANALRTEISFELPMPLQKVTCDRRVKANVGLVAWQQGPVVYSWEPASTNVVKGAPLTRVPYHLRLNRGVPSRVWIPADGTDPGECPEVGTWTCGVPVDAAGRKVERARLYR